MIKPVDKKTPYYCSKCKNYFKYNYQLAKHQCSDKGDKDAVLKKCKICHKTFNSEHMLQRHKNTKHKEVKATTKSNKVNTKKATKNKSNKESDDSDYKHDDQNDEEMDLDNDNDNDGNWNDNESSDDSDSDYKEKRKSIAKPQASNNPYLCNECDASYRFEKQLERHIKKHTEAYRFVCVLCWDRFKYPHMLQKHMEKHHPEENPAPKAAEPKPENVEKTHICSYCPSAYSNVGGLAQHMSKKHPELKPFKCDKCDKTFVVEEHLKIHTNRHMGIKNFKCDLCDKCKMKA